MAAVYESAVAVISIHAPAKGATTRPCKASEKRLIFQSTLPRRERHMLAVGWFAVDEFQSTLPRRERRALRRSKLSLSQFQSTLPRRERPSIRSDAYCHFYFNPRSREGSDLQLFRVRGKPPYFNPRSREGSDGRHERPVVRAEISIHAPAKGATYNAVVIAAEDDDFNPRSREGSDAVDTGSRQFRMNFNPRSREGSDGLREPRAKQPVHFNPRSREGSDETIKLVVKEDSISIHAPAKGATLDAL